MLLYLLIAFFLMGQTTVTKSGEPRLLPTASLEPFPHERSSPTELQSQTPSDTRQAWWMRKAYQVSENSTAKNVIKLPFYLLILFTGEWCQRSIGCVRRNKATSTIKTEGLLKDCWSRWSYTREGGVDSQDGEWVIIIYKKQLKDFQMGSCNNWLTVLHFIEGS